MDKKSSRTITVGCLQILLILLTSSDAVTESANSGDRTARCNPLRPNSTCAVTSCCVKQVITYQDVSKQALGTTVCQPKRLIGQFCLHNSEGYMCDCSTGLVCKTRHSENYGTCEPVDTSITQTGTK